MDRQEMEKMQRNTQYCKELHQQLVNKQQQQQCQYEDTLIEKKMLEEVMQTNADEDQRELEKKQRDTEEQWHEMVTSSQARVAAKEKQKKMIIIEDRQIEEQRQFADDRSAAVVEEREHKMRVKEELRDKISSRMMSDDAAYLERENITGLLQEQKYQEKHAQDDIAERENTERAKKEMGEDLTNQMDSMKQEAHKQRELDADFMKANEERMVVGDQKEHEKAMKIKEKNHQYGTDLRQQIEDNTCRRENEKKKEKAFEQAVSHYDENWRLEVRLEHDRVVSAHGGRVPECHSDLPYPRDGAASDPAP